MRVLRWTFHREDEIVVCELGLTADDSAYELRIFPPWNPTGITREVFGDAVSAFQRQTVIENILVKEGWSLERFESFRALRHLSSPDHSQPASFTDAIRG